MGWGAGDRDGHRQGPRPRKRSNTLASYHPTWVARARKPPTGVPGSLFSPPPWATEAVRDLRRGSAAHSPPGAWRRGGGLQFKFLHIRAENSETIPSGVTLRVPVTILWPGGWCGLIIEERRMSENGTVVSCGQCYNIQLDKT